MIKISKNRKTVEETVSELHEVFETIIKNSKFDNIDDTIMREYSKEPQEDSHMIGMKDLYYGFSCRRILENIIASFNHILTQTGMKHTTPTLLTEFSGHIGLQIYLQTYIRHEDAAIYRKIQRRSNY